MAKLSVTVIVIVTLFSFILTLSQARIPLNLPKNDVINTEATNAIRLPSDEASDVVHSSLAVMPLNFVSFRPINRQVFTLRSTRRLRRCGGRRFHRNFKPLGDRVEIPYGNDMIISSGENSGVDLMSSHGGLRQIRPKWGRFHQHHYHHHHDEDDEKSTKVKRVEGGLFGRFRKFLNQAI